MFGKTVIRFFHTWDIISVGFIFLWSDIFVCVDKFCCKTYINIFMYKGTDETWLKFGAFIAKELKIWYNIKWDSIKSYQVWCQFEILCFEKSYLEKNVSGVYHKSKEWVQILCSDLSIYFQLSLSLYFMENWNAPHCIVTNVLLFVKIHHVMNWIHLHYLCH